MSDTLSGAMLSDGTVTEAKLDSTFSSKVTNAYTQANNAYAKANTAISGAGDVTISGNLTIGGTLVLAESFEAINVSASGMGANINFDILSQSILYLTSASTANSTINFRANSTISLESYILIDQLYQSFSALSLQFLKYPINNLQSYISLHLIHEEN